MNIEEFAKLFEGKIDKTDIMNYYEETKKEAKTQYPTAQENIVEKEALRRLRIKLKRLVNSPAKLATGIILGATDVLDLGQLKIKKHLRLYNEDPQKAIANNIVDEDGNPIDNIETWPSGASNPNFRKPLPEHSFIRNVYGVAKIDDDYKFFRLTCRQDKAQINIPFSKGVQFRAIVKKDDNELEMVSSTLTNFKVADVDIDYKTAVEKYAKKYIVENLASLNSLDDDTDILFVEADILNLSDAPSAKGNYSIMVDDMSLSGEEVIGGWMSEDLRNTMDFGQDSQAIIMARLAKMEDNETKELRIMLNVIGIWADEASKVKTEEMKTENINGEEEIIIEDEE